MLAAIICATVIVAAQLAAGWRLTRIHLEAQAQWALERRELQAAHQDAHAQWAVERRELANRIQAPQHVPLAPQHTYEVPEPEPDESQLVGTVYVDPEYVGD